jgi:hypothetical protein
MFDPKSKRRDGWVARGTSKSRFLDNFFHLADLVLNLPANLFPNAFAFQVGIVCEPPYLFFDLALYFMNLAFNLILGTWLHFVVSSEMVLIPYPLVVTFTLRFSRRLCGVPMGILRPLESFLGVFQRLPGKLVSCEVISLTVRREGSAVRVSGELMHFGCSLV